MRRKANFIEFPGTGMWAMFEKSEISSKVNLFISLRPSDIKIIIIQDQMRLFWINRGTSAYQILSLAEGKKVSCGTLVTPRILKQYLKE